MKKLDNNQPDTPQGTPDEFETGSPEQTDPIIQIGGVTASKGKHVIHCLTIIGQIEGHYILPAQNKTTKYEHVIPQLLAVEQDPEIEGLVVILNTVGGDVEAGLAIAELLSGMRKPTVSLVLGVPQTLSYLDRMQERIVKFVTDNSRISPERFRQLMMNKDELVMDVGTVLDGQAAVDEGLIDSLGGVSDVIAALYEMIEGDVK